MTAPTPTRRAALTALREGRVTVLTAHTPDGHSTPDKVLARVSGHHGTYAIDHLDGAWTCTCRDGADGACAHVLAVQLVTAAVPA